MGSHSLLQGIFTTQGSNPGLLHCRQILYHLSHQGSPFHTVVVQSLSHVQLFPTPWTVAHQASLSFAISQSLLELMSIESVMPSNHLILCHPLLLMPSIFPSISVFSNELALCIRWQKYWSLSISLSNDYSELISFRMDWGSDQNHPKEKIKLSISYFMLFWYLVLELQCISHASGISSF